MNVIFITIIGVALAMDAFGVSLGIGVNSYVDRKKKIQYIMSFAFFQCILTLIGAVLGFYFDNFIVEIPTVFAGIVVAIVGILMIIDGKKSGEGNILLKDNMVIALGISVSIDALVVGFSSLHQLGNFLILFVDCILIGLITLFICTLAFFLSRYFRKINFVKKYADYFGGVALIILAIKMIFS